MQKRSLILNELILKKQIEVSKNYININYCECWSRSTFQYNTEVVLKLSVEVHRVCATPNRNIIEYYSTFNIG